MPPKRSTSVTSSKESGSESSPASPSGDSSIPIQSKEELLEATLAQLTGLLSDPDDRCFVQILPMDIPTISSLLNMHLTDFESRISKLEKRVKKLQNRKKKR